MMGGEDHAGGADAALGSTGFEENLLDGVELFVDGEAFDGGDLRVLSLQDGDQAGVDQVAVHQDGAGAALAFAAALFGSGKVKVFAEDVEEALHRWCFDGLGLVVYGELDGGHLEVPEHSGLGRRRRSRVRAIPTLSTMRPSRRWGTRCMGWAIMLVFPRCMGWIVMRWPR